MKIGVTLKTIVAVVMLASCAHAQDTVSWKDPSPHQVRLVSVGDDLRLEVLDWGGSGEPLVLIPGGGDTAHVFDDFAPKLTGEFHVYAITRRGFGDSGFAQISSGSDTFGDDVVAVLDALDLKEPVLVGHSVGGQELSSIGTRYPKRVRALVYLDAAYPYALGDDRMPTFKEFEAIGMPQAPPPTEADLATFDAWGHYYSRVLGITFPEAELRQKRFTAEGGRVGPPRPFPGGSVLLAGIRRYVDISAPTLFIVSSQSPGRWAEASTDPATRSQIDGLSALQDRQAKAIAEVVPNARVVKIARANHYVFLSHEAEVLKQMRLFLSELR